MALDEMRCEPCRGGISPLTGIEIDEYYKQLQSWSVVEKGGIKRLERSFKFKDFLKLLILQTRWAISLKKKAIILTEWGMVTVSWWTHKIRGIHRNDFIMAAKTDTLT